MAQEIEIKLRISDAKSLKRALKRLRALPVGGGTGRVHEWNVIFDTPEGGLAKHGQLLRIRTETQEARSKKRQRTFRPTHTADFQAATCPGNRGFRQGTTAFSPQSAGRI